MNVNVSKIDANRILIFEARAVFWAENAQKVSFLPRNKCLLNNSNLLIFMKILMWMLKATRTQNAALSNSHSHVSVRPPFISLILSRPRSLPRQLTQGTSFNIQWNNIAIQADFHLIELFILSLSLTKFVNYRFKINFNMELQRRLKNIKYSTFIQFDRVYLFYF